MHNLLLRSLIISAKFPPSLLPYNGHRLQGLGLDIFWGAFFKFPPHYHLCSLASPLHAVLRYLTHCFTDSSILGHSNPTLPALRPKPHDSSSFSNRRTSLSKFLPSQPSTCPELDHPWPAPPKMWAPSPRADDSSPGRRSSRYPVTCPPGLESV